LLHYDNSKSKHDFTIDVDNSRLVKFVPMCDVPNCGLPEYHLGNHGRALTPEASENDSCNDGAACETCKSQGDEEQMLLCDGCDKGYHIYCLRPKLTKIPDNVWTCKACQPIDAVACQTCKSRLDEEKMLLCDGCDLGYHMHCLVPKLKVIPHNDWTCKKCTANGLQEKRKEMDGSNKKSETTTRQKRAAPTEEASNMPPRKAVKSSNVEMCEPVPSVKNDKKVQATGKAADIASKEDWTWTPSFASSIKVTMAEKKMSQLQLAILLGIEGDDAKRYPALNHWLGGQSLHLSSVVAAGKAVANWYQKAAALISSRPAGKTERPVVCGSPGCKLLIRHLGPCTLSTSNNRSEIIFPASNKSCSWKASGEEAVTTPSPKVGAKLVSAPTKVKAPPAISSGSTIRQIGPCGKSAALSTKLSPPAGAAVGAAVPVSVASAASADSTPVVVACKGKVNGIVFKVGVKVSVYYAKADDWYIATVRKVDPQARNVLLHYDKSKSKHDFTIDVDNSRLVKFVPMCDVPNCGLPEYHLGNHHKSTLSNKVSPPVRAVVRAAAVIPIKPRFVAKTDHRSLVWTQTLSASVLELMVEQNTNQTALAKKFNIDRSVVSHWIHGRFNHNSPAGRHLIEWFLGNGGDMTLVTFRPTDPKIPKGDLKRKYAE
jgi:hypothetical protein